MNKVTIEKLNALRERNLIDNQAEFERVFKETEMGTLKLDQIIEFMQYVVGGNYFDLKNLRWVKGKKEKILKATLDLDNGYLSREVYLGDNICYPAAYVESWKGFKELKLPQTKTAEELNADQTQLIVELDCDVNAAASTVEAY